MKRMIHFQKDFKLFEIIVYAVLWLVIFFIPFFHYRVYGTIVWDKVLEEWVSMLGFLLIFLLNVSVFVPKFLFKKHYFNYILLVLLCSGFFVSVTLKVQDAISFKSELEMPPMEIGPGMPPMELSSQMPPPRGFNPNSDQVKGSAYIHFLDYLLIAILIIAASTSFELFSRWIKEERKNEQLENERLKSELALLRNQVSPHFLMNTLNNILALIELNPEKAKDAVIRLSTLMRYLLYDTSAGKTSLHKEVGFIESYFVLMKLRYSKEVDLKLEVPEELPDLTIPPMLFISFLENAFKHGVSYNRDSFVFFQLEIEESRLKCHICNSVHPDKEKPSDHYSGIGLVNVKKSLDLLYPDNYILNIDNNGQEFTVSLSLPI